MSTWIGPFFKMTHDCPICLEDIKDAMVVGDCMHMLCKDCFNMFLKSKKRNCCPVCREKTKLPSTIADVPSNHFAPSNNPWNLFAQLPVVRRYSPIRRQRRQIIHCRAVLSSGRRRGQACGAKCKIGKDYCGRSGHNVIIIT